MEDTIVISSADLVNHADLGRKRAEVIFRKEFLVRKGADEADEHVQALHKQLEALQQRISPIEEKMKRVDILSIVPNRAEIFSLTNEIEQHPAQKLDEALREKRGEVYDLLKKRSAYTNANYGNREQIARLTILLNLLPRKEAEGLRAVLESHASEVIDVSSLDQQRQKDLVESMGRLGICAYIAGSRLSLEKKAEEEAISWQEEVEKKYADAGGLMKTAWVSKGNEAEWENNELRLSTVSRRIQGLIAKGHAEPLNEAESAEFG
ncbi:MAG: hypothetical protein V1822_04150, partial [Candidatus Micrarchaeota archaeon]